MLSMPLQQAYAADFYFGKAGEESNPSMSIQRYDEDEGTSSGTGAWRDDSINVELNAGSPFILYLDNNIGTSNGLGLSGGIIELPYFDDSFSGVLPNVHPGHSYSSPNSSISINSGDVTSYNLARDLSRAYSLAGKDVSTPLHFLVGAQGNSAFALVGNPYMSSIDFDALSSNSSNSLLIKSSYLIWTGEAYQGYSLIGGSVGFYEENNDIDSDIAPWQSFFVEKDEDLPEGQHQLNFDLEEISPTSRGNTLKSSASKTDMLEIIAENPFAAVRTVIASLESGSSTVGKDDMSKLFSDVNDVPDVYTLKPTANDEIAAVAVNVLDRQSGETFIPLCLRTAYKGETKLKLSGMAAYDATISLIDRYENKEIDLTGLDSYVYTFNHAPKKSANTTVSTDDRFEIRLNYGAITGTAYIPKAEAWVSGGDKSLDVYSSQPIRRLTVYSPQGIVLKEITEINAAKYRVSSLSTGIYIVRIWTDAGQVTKKAIVK
jgi:hypothetical protein